MKILDCLIELAKFISKKINKIEIIMFKISPKIFSEKVEVKINYIN
jgi:hypothetical protein